MIKIETKFLRQSRQVVGVELYDVDAPQISEREYSVCVMYNRALWYILRNIDHLLERARYAMVVKIGSVGVGLSKAMSEVIDKVALVIQEEFALLSALNAMVHPSLHNIH